MPPPTISPTPILTQPSTKRISQYNIIISQCSGCSRFSTLDNSRICAEYRIKIQERPTIFEVFTGFQPPPLARVVGKKARRHCPGAADPIDYALICAMMSGAEI